MKLIIQLAEGHSQEIAVTPRQVVEVGLVDDDGKPIQGVDLIANGSSATLILPSALDRSLVADVVWKLSEWGALSLPSDKRTVAEFGRWLSGGNPQDTKPMQLKNGDEGLDVSHWQGAIDWPNVVLAGKKFAFIKASEGTKTDVKFSENWTRARDAGIMRGAYCFFNSAVPVETQANYFIGLLKNDLGELPPVLDVESNQSGTSRASYTQALRLWLGLVEQALQRRPIIYTSASKWKELTDSPVWAKEYPLWVAHYTQKTAPLLPPGWDHYQFWQYTDKGRVDGIQGNADLNRYGGA